MLFPTGFTDMMINLKMSDDLEMMLFIWSLLPFKQIFLTLLYLSQNTVFGE